VTLPPYL